MTNHGGLSVEKIRELVSSKRGNKHEDAVTINDWLEIWEEENDFVYCWPVAKLAIDVGMSEARVRVAIAYMRTPEWIKATGRSIPYQPRGRGLKSLGVVDADKNLLLLKAGNELHSKYMITEAHNQLVQYKFERDLQESIVDRQLLNVVVSMQEVIINTLEQIKQYEHEREEQAV